MKLMYALLVPLVLLLTVLNQQAFAQACGCGCGRQLSQCRSDCREAQKWRSEQLAEEQWVRRAWKTSDNAADVLTKKVGTRKASGDCAMYVQRALTEAGVKIGRGNAEAWGGENGLLHQAGFREITGSYRKGDVVVVDPIPGHPHGHVAIYNGTRWVSDFAQNSINPYNPTVPGGARPEITYKIYRYKPYHATN